MYQNSSIIEDIKRGFGNGNMVTRLIFINVGGFLLINIVHLVFFLVGSGDTFNSILKWFMVPAHPSNLITRPWSLFTYMFMQEGFLHLLFNMLYLYWFGRIFTLFLSDKKILPLYILGGLAGALLFIISFNLFPSLKAQAPDAFMLGASAAVLSIVVASATAQPDYTIHLFFFGAVRIKYIAIIVVLIDIFSIPREINIGGHIAHLGGAIMGYVFIKQLYMGNDWSKGFNKIFYSVIDAFKPGSSKPKVVHRTTSSQGRSKNQSKPSIGKQEKLDEILDKISRSGYDSLSTEEKAFLFNVSKDDE